MRSPSVGATPETLPASDGAISLTLGACPHHAAGAAHRGGQGDAQPAWIDRVVLGQLERQPQRRGERRFEPPRLARPQASDREAELRAHAPARGRAPRPRRCRERRAACRTAGSPGRTPEASASSATNAGYCSRARERQPQQRALDRAWPRRSARSCRRRRARCRRPGSPRSNTVDRKPCSAARHATARPIAPPPITATSNDLVALDKLASSAGITRVRFRRSADLGPPSQPGSRAPVGVNASAALLPDLERARPSPATSGCPAVPRVRRPPRRRFSWLRCGAGSTSSSCAMKDAGDERDRLRRPPVRRASAPSTARC